ncbi:hypothetical protein PRIC1_012677 [Phytophthora ramorum]
MSPDASTESSSSPSSVSNAQVAPAPKKKRVRRQQVELQQLRELAGKLEHRLEQLKKRRVASCAPSKNNKCVSSNSLNKVNDGPVCVWETIADRQFRERLRVVKQNEELKLTLRSQSNMAQTLQIRVQKALGGEQQQTERAMLQRQNEDDRYWDMQSGDDEGIFAALLTLVVRIRLEVKRRRVEDPRSALSYATWGISVGEPHVRTDSDVGLVLETHGCSLLPFNVKTTAAAYWKMFSLSPMHKLTSIDAVTSDAVARSFTCSSTHLGRKIDVRGKHTCRKYVDKDGCVTIVFAGRTGPAEVRTPCQEVQLQKSGWIRVRQLHPEGPDQQSSAIVEMHSETQPRFRNGSAGQEKRAREVIDWVSKSHQVVSDWYRQKLSEILVEEDWRAFRGGETAVTI